MDTHGQHGIRELCGTTPRRLSRDEIYHLLPGTLVHVTWDGGNGPHKYKVVGDATHQLIMDALFLEDRICRVRVVDLLDDYGCYVSLVNDAYYTDHAACPKCGNVNIVSTCAGIIRVEGAVFRDTNKTTCNDCGFMGIVHDLVRKKQ